MFLFEHIIHHHSSINFRASYLFSTQSSPILVNLNKPSPDRCCFMTYFYMYRHFLCPPFFRPWSDLQVTICALTVHEKAVSVTDNGLMNRVIGIYYSLFWGFEASSFSECTQSLFLGHVRNCERRLIASSCPSVRPHGTTRLPLDGF